MIEIYQEPLERARKTYGHAKQLSVCREELAELIQALEKYNRYDDERAAVENTRNSVLDEAADVYIILEHVKAIFELGDELVTARIGQKLERLTRWMDTSPHMEQTMKDRRISDDDKGV